MSVLQGRGDGHGFDTASRIPMDHLSDDELCKILGLLTVQQVPAADATCRRWHTVARSNALWKKMLLAHYPAASKLPSNDCRSLFRSMQLQLRPPEMLPVPLDDVVMLFEMHRLNGERISLALPFNRTRDPADGDEGIYAEDGTTLWTGVSEIAKAPEEIRIDSVKAWRACDNKVCFFGNRNGTLQWEHVPDAGHYIQPVISSDIGHVVKFAFLTFQLNVTFHAALGGSIKMSVVVLWTPPSEWRSQNLKVRNAFSYLLMPAMPWK